jgi:NADPH:quinone reductase-like Zn-dependent oxidoreductase
VKAAVVRGKDPPVYGDFDEPSATSDGMVVAVRAAALTHLDVAVAERRHYLSPDAAAFIAGKEAVAETSSGERFFFNASSILTPFGSMAERTLVRLDMGLPVPDAVPDALAAALGNAGLAAWLALSSRARLRPGETVLILGATGASGLIAVSAAKLLGAGRVIAAGRNPAALIRAQRLGADAVIKLDATADLLAAMRDAAGAEIDVVIDFLNGPPAETALPAMAVGGRMVQISSLLAPGIFLRGQTTRKASLDILGFAYYHAPLEEQAAAYELLCRHAAAGRIEIDIATMSLDAIEDAWQRRKAGRGPRLVLMPAG